MARRIVISFLAAVAGGGATFILWIIGLLVFAQLTSDHLSSTAGVWAYVMALPVGAVGAVASFIGAFIKLKSKP